MPGLGYSRLATESNSARPHSAPAEEGDVAVEPTGEQRVCGRGEEQSPHSAPSEASTHGSRAWQLAERLLGRLEIWDVQRPTRHELMTYAREAPYTLPTTVTENAKGDPVKHITKLRRLGIAYAWAVSRNVHSLAYAALWVLRQPSRATAKVSRPTLEQLFEGARDSSGPAQWVNVALLAAHTAVYSFLWLVERPSRLLAAAGAAGVHVTLAVIGF